VEATTAQNKQAACLEFIGRHKQSQRRKTEEIPVFNTQMTLYTKKSGDLSGNHHLT
jgi:hypothetical protein